MNYKPISKLSPHFLLSIALIALPLLLFGCSNGSDGAPGTSSGTVTGSVIDAFNNKVANVTVTPSPAVDSLPGGKVTTDASGNYSMTLPNGTYTLTFANAAYITQTLSVSVVATQSKANATITLVPVAAAIVTVTPVGATFPATGSVTLTATPVLVDPALVGKAAAFQWKDQLGNVLGTSASLTVNRPSTATLKANVAKMVAPLASIDPAPATVDENGEESEHKDLRTFTTLDRLMVVGIPMKAYEDIANPTYTVAVTISGQTFTQTVAVGAGTSGLPFVANPGLRNVPIGQPVMLQGPDGSTATGTATQTTWNWTLTKPAGSAASLDLIDKATRFPHFTPDVVGTYTVAETVSAKSLKIYAGKWVGMLQPAFDGSDNPLGDVDPGCLSGGGGLCHSTATLAKFTDWRNSGHSLVMVQGMAEGSHYSLANCAKCHSVGGTYLGADSSAGSFRDVAAATGYTNATFLSKLILSLDPAVTQKSKFFQGFPQVLKLSEIQCEACHGPNSSGDVHGPSRPNAADAKDARVSFSAEVCGACHGEPTRHGRYQEWRESGHGNFETAIHEGISGSSVNSGCAGCHAGQAFPLLVAQLEGGNPQRTLTAASIAALANVNASNVQPQTCSVCHTSHDVGKLPGLVGSVVNLRGDFQSGGAFDGVTPLLPAGFQANGVGRGALCITCHNSRNGGSGTTVGLHEDGDPLFGTLTSYSAPHEAAQGDVLMGRNAYFFGSGQIGQRSKHSLLADACVTCHLEKTPADPASGFGLTTAGAGTNHSFGIVTDPTLTVDAQVNALCQQCHGSFEGTGVQKAFTTAYNTLMTETQNAILRIKYGSIGAIPAGTKLVFIPGRTPTVSVNGAAAVNLSTYLANAPGTPATGPIPASGFQIDLAKVNWNAELVILDASSGVHNPSFSQDVIAATLKRVKGL